MHDQLIQCNCLIFSTLWAEALRSRLIQEDRRVNFCYNFDKAVAKLKALLLKLYHTCLFHLTKQLNKLCLICSMLKLWIYENPICNLRSEELFVQRKIIAVIYATYAVAKRKHEKKIQACIGLELLNSTTCSQLACLLNWYIHNFIVIIKLCI